MDPNRRSVLAPILGTEHLVSLAGAEGVKASRGKVGRNARSELNCTLTEV